MTKKKGCECKLGIDEMPIGVWSLTWHICPLHAAARDLLAACKLLLDGLDEYWITLPEGIEAVDIAEAAIAKAEGVEL